MEFVRYTGGIGQADYLWSMPWLSLIFLIGALALRKLEWPFGQTAWLLALLLFFLDWTSTLHRRKPSTLLLWIFLLLGACLALYMRYGMWSLYGRTASLIGLACLLPILAIQRRRLSRWQRINGLAFLVLLCAGILLNDWSHYHIFRGKNVEEILLARMRDDREDTADRLIERMLPWDARDSVSASTSLAAALVHEAARELDQAKARFDHAIYLDPYDADAYFNRASFKLQRLDLDQGTAESALRDFSRAIRLDSGQARYWYMRAHTLGYLNYRKRVCLDALRAFGLDTSLREGCQGLMLRFCPDSCDFLARVPLDP